MILILISCKPYIAMVLGYKKRFSLNSRVILPIVDSALCES